MKIKKYFFLIGIVFMFSAYSRGGGWGWGLGGLGLGLALSAPRNRTVVVERERPVYNYYDDENAKLREEVAELRGEIRGRTSAQNNQNDQSSEDN